MNSINLSQATVAQAAQPENALALASHMMVAEAFINSENMLLVIKLQNVPINDTQFALIAPETPDKRAQQPFVDVTPLQQPLLVSTLAAPLIQLTLNIIKKGKLKFAMNHEATLDYHAASETFLLPSSLKLLKINGFNHHDVDLSTAQQLQHVHMENCRILLEKLPQSLVSLTSKSIAIKLERFFVTVVEANPAHPNELTLKRIGSLRHRLPHLAYLYVAHLPFGKETLARIGSTTTTTSTTRNDGNGDSDSPDDMPGDALWPLAFRYLYVKHLEGGEILPSTLLQFQYDIDVLAWTIAYEKEKEQKRLADEAAKQQQQQQEEQRAERERQQRREAELEEDYDFIRDSPVYAHVYY